MTLSSFSMTFHHQGHPVITSDVSKTFFRDQDQDQESKTFLWCTAFNRCGPSTLICDTVNKKLNYR